MGHKQERKIFRNKTWVTGRLLLLCAVGAGAGARWEHGRDGFFWVIVFWLLACECVNAIVAGLRKGHGIR